MYLLGTLFHPTLRFGFQMSAIPPLITQLLLANQVFVVTCLLGAFVSLEAVLLNCTCSNNSCMVTFPRRICICGLFVKFLKHVGMYTCYLSHISHNLNDTCVTVTHTILQ